MRGRSFSGFIRDGNKLASSSDWAPGAVAHPNEVHNLSTRSMVKVDRRHSTMNIVVGLIFLLMLIGWIVVVTLGTNVGPNH